MIGVASSGFHSNGYSLIRRVVFDIAGLSVSDVVPEVGRTVGEILLSPTRIYAQAIRGILRHYRKKRVVHGIAHITGGGLRENLERIMPEGSRAIINRAGWPKPPEFGWLQRLGEIDDDEMDRVFNMGIGLVLVVAPYYADSVREQLADAQLANWPIGHIASGPRGVVWSDAK